VRSATALALIAAGAILSFAVSAQVPGISLRLTGVILILAGVAATVLPPSPAADWLRRRGRPAPQAGPGPDAASEDLDAEYPAYLLQDPAVLAAEVLNGIRADSWPQPAAPRPPDKQARPPGPRPLRSVRFDAEDGFG
jgi:hypothetical protein